mmetsp:Transcript_4494/g.11546  ORF Transcript_4494/g.11546 Transcript_4494/m.11546 type:complete len:210 (+) Transcript_4494:47-676(+)
MKSWLSGKRGGKSAEAIDLNVFQDGAETKDERVDAVTAVDPPREKPPTSPAAPESSAVVVTAVVVESAREKQAKRESRYRKEITDLRESIVAHRTMWEKLVKDWEAEVVELRHQLTLMLKERDALRHEVETEKLAADARTKELTDDLVRVKMRSAELNSETQMLQHHAHLVAKRRDATLAKKHHRTKLFHTCVDDDAATDDDDDDDQNA